MSPIHGRSYQIRTIYIYITEIRNNLNISITKTEKNDPKPVLFGEEFVLVDLSTTALHGIAGAFLPLIRHYHLRQLLLACNPQSIQNQIQPKHAKLNKKNETPHKWKISSHTSRKPWPPLLQPKLHKSFSPAKGRREVRRSPTWRESPAAAGLFFINKKSLCWPEPMGRSRSIKAHLRGLSSHDNCIFWLINSFFLILKQ